MLKLLSDPKAYEVPKYASLIVQLRGTFKVTHLTEKNTSLRQMFEST